MKSGKEVMTMKTNKLVVTYGDPQAPKVSLTLDIDDDQLETIGERIFGTLSEKRNQRRWEQHRINQQREREQRRVLRLATRRGGLTATH
jgi:hypothetical protein